MSLFDACEQFFKQINPQHFSDDEENDDDFAYCPSTVEFELFKYLTCVQNYLWGKKQN